MSPRPGCAPGGCALLKALAGHLAKDFRIEFRSRYALSVSLSFALIVTIAVSLSAGGASLSRGAGAMLLWIILFFSAMGGLSHIFMREAEEGTALFLRLHGSPSLVYFGKLAFNIAMMCANGIVIAPLFIFFTGARVAAPLSLAAIVASGCLAIASSTALISAIVARAGGKGSLFTVLSLPIALPVLWAGIGASSAAMARADAPVLAPVLFLLAFSGALVAVSYMLFEYVWTED